MSTRSLGQRMTVLVREIAAEPMVKISDIEDLEALNTLLKLGHLFNPIEGYVRSVKSLDDSTGKTEESHKWVWVMPKPKNKKDHPIPYQFEEYANMDEEFTEANGKLDGNWRARLEIKGYIYGLRSGGVFRRPVKQGA